MKLKATRWLATAVLTALLPVVAGCGGGSGTGGGEVEMWVRDSGASVAKSMVEAYNASHPQTPVKVTVVPSGQYLTKLANAIAGGNPPDLATSDFTNIAQLGSTNQLVDLTERAEALPFFPDGLSKTHVRSGTVGDKIVALPFSGEASILIYNKDLYRQAGLDPEKAPTTWAELQEHATKIRAIGPDITGFYFSGQCGGCNTFAMLPLVWATGGDILDETGTTATIEGNAALRDTLTFYRDMWTQGLIDPSAQSDNGTNFATAFQSRKVGIIFLGAFGISAIKSEHPDLDFGVGYLPGKDGEWSSYAGGDDIAIPQGSDNVDAAWDFIQWSLQTEQQVDHLAKNSVVPVRTDDAMTRYKALDPRHEVTGSAEMAGKAPYAVNYQALFNDANGPFNTMVQEAVFGGDVDAAMRKAQAGFDEILAKQ